MITAMLHQHRKATMKRIVTLFLLVIITGTSHGIHLYSRALAEKQVSDSLKAIDSVRVADSLHVADSMVTARYAIADTVYKNEKIKKKAEQEAAMPVKVDSSQRITSEDVDNVSARTIEIDDGSPYAKVIDSIQNRFDAVYDSIHNTDPWYKKMKTYHVTEKKRYMNYLLKNNMKDTASLLIYCNKLYEMYQMKIDLLIAIRKAQKANDKLFVTYHIEEQKRRIAELTEFLVALTPVVPFAPTHGRVEE